MNIKKQLVALFFIVLMTSCLSACGGGGGDGGSGDGGSGPPPTPPPPSSGPNGSGTGNSDSNSGTAYVTERFSGQLSAINLHTGEISVVTSKLVGPSDVAISNDGATAYVTEYDGGYLSAVDLQSGKIRTLLPLVKPLDVDVAANGTLYVIELGGENTHARILAVNPATGQSELVTKALSYPFDMVLMPNKNTALVIAHSAIFKCRLYEVDLSTGAISQIPKFLTRCYLSSNPVVDYNNLVVDHDIGLLDGGEFALVTPSVEVDLSTGNRRSIGYSGHVLGAADFVHGSKGQAFLGVVSDGILRFNPKTGELSVVAVTKGTGFEKPTGIDVAP